MFGPIIWLLRHLSDSMQRASAYFQNEVEMSADEKAEADALRLMRCVAGAVFYLATLLTVSLLKKWWNLNDIVLHSVTFGMFCVAAWVVWA